MNCSKVRGVMPPPPFLKSGGAAAPPAAPLLLPLWFNVLMCTCIVHAGLKSNSIPETPAPRTAPKTSPFSSSLSQDNTFRLNGSAIDPITLGDSDSSDDSEPEMVPLCNRIGLGSSTVSITPSQTASSKASLTPSQAAGAAAVRRLNVLESRTKCTGPPLLDLDSDHDTKGKKSASIHQRAKQLTRSRSNEAVREQLEKAPSTSAGTSCSSVSLFRPQTSHQSTTGEQNVDLNSPEFTLRPGMAVYNILHSLCHS